MIKIVIWGTGKTANKYMDRLYNLMREFVQILAFIDNDIEKQKTDFWGYKVISYEQVHEYSFDYIVIINRFVKEIYKQIGQEYEKDKTVILLSRFFEIFVSGNYLKGKRILFYGDCMNYELVEYRARFTFQYVNYIEKGHLDFINKFDYVFLCPPRLTNPQEKACYENELRREVSAVLNNSDEAVVEFDDWFPYLQGDRRIAGGNKNKGKKFFIIASSDPIQGWGNVLVRIWGGDCLCT